MNAAPCPRPGLLVSPLCSDDETAAYALARWAKPDLPPERWENFLCDWRADPDGRGILVARNQRGGILGFVCWWRQPDLEHGETLWAGPFFVREMGVRPLVRDALDQELQHLSRSMGAALRITPDATVLVPPHSTLV
ncbi:hypothetical protein GCM10009093_27660 [Brevundimonas terrae]|uniref:GNAT family N-acetyltransferase n=2 Tax=Brevundimonas terrae TaxID=363631 RepID=A0ABP3IEG9_9CAUL